MTASCLCKCIHRERELYVYMYICIYRYLHFMYISVDLGARLCAALYIHPHASRVCFCDPSTHTNAQDRKPSTTALPCNYIHLPVYDPDLLNHTQMHPQTYSCGTLKHKRFQVSVYIYIHLVYNSRLSMTHTRTHTHPQTHAHTRTHKHTELRAIHKCAHGHAHTARGSPKVLPSIRIHLQTSYL